MGQKSTANQAIQCLLLKLLIMAFISTCLANMVMAQEANIVVSPSGDTTGVTDADNIAWALGNVAPGGVVVLTSGHFFVSRCILVENFSGSLKGAGKDETIIEAVRKSDAEGFSFENIPDTSKPRTMLLLLNYPTGQVTLEDLTLQVTDPNPSEPNPDTGSVHFNKTSMTHLLFFRRGIADISVNNVRFRGAEGDHRGKNTYLGFLRNRGEGSVTVENSDCEYCVYGLDVWQMEKGLVTIEANIVSNCYSGISIGTSGSVPSIIASAISGNTVIGSTDTYLNISTRRVNNCTISENTITGFGVISAIYVNRSNNNVISGNTIENFEVGQLIRAPIYFWQCHDNIISNNTFDTVGGGTAGIRLRGGSSGNILLGNNYRYSNLPGWTDINPDGPGCVLLDVGTLENDVAECLFPDDTTASSQIRDFGDNQILPCSVCSIYLIENMVDSLQEAIDNNPHMADKLEDVIDKLETARDELYKIPPDKQAAIGNIEGAIGDIEAGAKDGLYTFDDAAPFMDDLAGIARYMALEAITAAENNNGKQDEISDAQEALAEGDALREEGKYKDAVNKYKDALAKGESANPYLD